MSLHSQEATPPLVAHHLLLCATPSKPLCCNDRELGQACWDTLKRLVRDLGLEDPRRMEGVVWRSKVDCLRICREGPILHLWPSGITYGAMTPQRIERILHQHILNGEPVREWIISQTPLALTSADGATTGL